MGRVSLRVRVWMRWAVLSPWPTLSISSSFSSARARLGNAVGIAGNGFAAEFSSCPPNPRRRSRGTCETGRPSPLQSPGSHRMALWPSRRQYRAAVLV